MKWISNITSKITQSKNTLVKDIYDQIPDSSNKFDAFGEVLKTKEEEFLLEIFTHLNYSVLEGEYLNEKFSIEINKLISLVDTFFQFPDLSFIANTTVEGRYTEYLSNTKFLYSFKQCLEEYSKNKDFIDGIILKLDKILVFNLSDRSHNIIEDLKFEKKNFELILSTIFLENLTLSRKEFTLRNNEENLESLLNLNISFKQCLGRFPFPDDNIKFILDILIDKTTFLIRKLIIRKNQELNSENQYYVASGIENSFLLETHLYISQQYDKWDDYSQIHYLSEENDVYARKLKSFSNSNETYWDRHRLIKIAKDFDKKIKDLEDIKLDNIVIQNIIFNKYSKKISENYIQNCTLSCSVEKEKEKISVEFNFNEFLEKEKEKIKKIQSESVIENFFPYKKLAEFTIEYIKHINKELRKGDTLKKELIEKLEIANNSLEEIIKKYKTTLNWCRNHFFYAYQLPFEECILTYKISEDKYLNVFSPSTFSLPLDYESLLKEIDGLESKNENFKNEIKSLSNFSILFEKLESKVSIQEQVLENNTKKNIELLGIFSAIIALLFQGAYTSNSETTFENKLFTFIIMFIALVSFMLMLKVFVSNKVERGELMTIRIISFLIIPLLIITIIILFKLYN
ncbi:hypothetical protein ASF10_03940 [Flavobacterium sp. Leaf82]|uniref:hypothetical protein n=1 Tax=unclassified Flavobacterium TaxID=196869 RepID=UPI0006FA1027|nr:hypothetical protein [Flavobacterium sp. Leaf82]KQO29667.1 hypothetical protein ASF10_03940 [Flavobacterium sp. Leaf82]